jgi:hypothetical protein
LEGSLRGISGLINSKVNIKKLVQHEIRSNGMESIVEESSIWII